MYFSQVEETSLVVEIEKDNSTQKFGKAEIKARFLQKYENFLNNPNLDPNYRIKKV